MSFIMTQLPVVKELGCSPYDSPRAIITGNKTQTRRISKPDERLVLVDGKRTVYNPPTEKYPNGTMKWQVGRVYSVVPKRSQPTVWYLKTDNLPKLAHDTNCSDDSDYTYLEYANDLVDVHPNTNYKDQLEMLGFRPLKIRITGIELQPLQCVTEQDAIDEGVLSKYHSISDLYWHYRELEFQPITAIDSYVSLLEKINNANLWDTNPLVWKLTFEVSNE
jgi:hypothetical protein